MLAAPGGVMAAKTKCFAPQSPTKLVRAPRLINLEGPWSVSAAVGTQNKQASRQQNTNNYLRLGVECGKGIV